MTKTRNRFGALFILVVIIALQDNVFAGIAFEEVTGTAGISHSSMTYGEAWGDFNGDGFADIWVNNHKWHPSLYLNQRDGTFTEVSDDVWSADEGADTHGAAWGDFDNDGDQDLVELTGSTQGRIPHPGHVFINQEGVLIESAQVLGLDYPKGRGRTPLWLDYDNDGFLDVLFSTGASEEAPTVLFRQANSGFTNVSEAEGLDVNSQSSQFALLTDLTLDGRLDLAIQGVARYPLKVYDIQTVPFTDVTNSVGLPSAKKSKDVAMADYNNDGLPDVYAARFSDSISGYLQETPSEVALALKTPYEEKGITFKASAGSLSFRVFTHWNHRIENFHIGEDGHAPEQFTNEGFSTYTFTLRGDDPSNVGIMDSGSRPDSGIYIGYDPATQLWQFVVRHIKGFKLDAIIQAESFIIDVETVGFDVDEPQLEDMLFVNTETGFVDQTTESGLGEPTSCPAVVSGDFDNDMDTDLYLVCTGPVRNLPNILYENLGNGFFEAVEEAGGAGGSTLGRGDSVATADYDNDGFLDLFVTNGSTFGLFSDGPHQLFRNVGNSNNWIEIELEGVMSNRDGIGARLLLTVGGVTQLREQNGGTHSRAQDFKRIHFGLGNYEKVEKLEIHWPSGIIQTVTNMPANQIIRILESPGQPVSLRGKPDIYQAPGVFLWQDYYDGPSHIRVHGGVENQVYHVNVISDRDVSNVILQDVEPADVLNVSSRGFDFQATTAQWVDGVDFNLIPGARTMVSVEGPDGANPRLLFIGQEGQHVAPAGWIVAKDDLPEFAGYVRGETQGMTFGKIGTGSLEYKLRWTSRYSSHRYSLWLAAAEPGLVVEDAGLLEVGDQMTSNDSAVLIDGGITSPWEDGINLTDIDGDMIALAFSMNGLFQHQFVNLFQANGTRFPNAYWLDSPSPVGEPLSEAGLPLAKIWKEEGQSRWHIKFIAGGGEHVYYSGEICSTGTLSLVDTSSLEAADNVDASVAGSLIFDLRVYGDWHDEIVFEAEGNDTLTFALDGPDGSQYVRIGKEGWPVRALPVVLQ